MNVSKAKFFRYEDGLDKVSERVSVFTGVAISDRPAPTNVSKLRPVNISQASLDLIADYYSSDFEKYGYTIDVPPLPGVRKT